ncbi:MAG: molybdopterin-dependent oxidoreductase, partial [Chloroflexota bacterium]
MVKKKATYCRICEAACGLIADVDASNQVLKLRPDMTHPVSKGFMCAKGSQFAKISAHPKRLREPQIRGENGRFQPANWETAYEKIEQALVPILEKYGPHAIGVYYGNPMLFNSLGLVSMLRFNRVLGTRNVYSSFSQDCNNKFKAAQIIHGGELIQPIPDLEHAELGLFFG